MAEEEHLKLLREGPKSWNSWRVENSTIIPDLSEASLERADLEEFNLSRANFNRADLNRARLRAAILIEADLSGALLDYADLFDANLAGASLTKASLIRSAFNRTTMSDADLSEAVLLRTVLGEINLSRTRGLDRCRHNGPSIVDFQTVRVSEGVTTTFWRGCGLPEALIDYLPSLISEPLPACAGSIGFGM